MCGYIDRAVISKHFKCRSAFFFCFFVFASFAQVTFAFSKLISVWVCGAYLHFCMCFYSLPYVLRDGTWNFHFSLSFSLLFLSLFIFIYAKLRERESKNDSSHSLNLIKINFISLLPIQFPVRRFLIHHHYHFIFDDAPHILFYTFPKMNFPTYY